MGRRFTVGTTETNLPPHYMFRRGVKGFKGGHFLEEGLAAAVEVARVRLAELLGIAIRHLPQPSVQKFGQFRGAGIGFRVVENVSELKRIDVNRAMVRAFNDSLPFAKRESDSAFNSFKQSDDDPLTDKTGYVNTTASYKFELFRSGTGIGMRPTGRGSKKNVAKVRALNFGLRTSFTDYQEEDED